MLALEAAPVLVVGEPVLKFDGAEVISAAAGREMAAKMAGAPAERRETLERAALDRARDLCAVSLYRLAGIDDSPAATADFMRVEIAAGRLKTPEGVSPDAYADKRAGDAATRFRLAAGRWIDQEFGGKVTVDDSELQEFYAANLPMFVVPEKRRIALIARARSPENDRIMGEVTAKLRQGERFDVLKAQYDEVSGVAAELLIADGELNSAAEKLTPESDAGLVLLERYAVAVKLAEYAPERLLSCEEAAPTLRKSLKDLKIRTAVNSALSAEAAKHKIEINPGVVKNDL